MSPRVPFVRFYHSSSIPVRLEPPISLSRFVSVVSQPADEGNGNLAAKRRRVTAEMEGKYIVNMPKGTTARTRRILAQQAKKGRPDPVARSPRRQLASITLLLLTKRL